MPNKEAAGFEETVNNIPEASIVRKRTLSREDPNNTYDQLAADVRYVINRLPDDTNVRDLYDASHYPERSPISWLMLISLISGREKMMITKSLRPFVWSSDTQTLDDVKKLFKERPPQLEDIVNIGSKTGRFILRVFGEPESPTENSAVT